MLIANILGFFAFLYLYWKRLKDDYSSEKIFNSGFIIIFGIIIGLLISQFLFSRYWFWIIFFLILISLIIIVFKLKLKFYESLDALVVSSLAWLSFFYLADSINNSSLPSFLFFWVSSISIFIYFLLNNFYRRVGFVGLATLVIFFLIKLIFFKFSTLDLYLSATVAILSFLLLYKLSRKND